MKNKILNMTIKVAMALTIIVSSTSFADSPKYPPYPDVWGTDLYDYAEEDSASGIMSTELDQNGDYVFTTISKRTDEENEHAFFNLSYFFSGKNIDIHGDKIGKYSDEKQLSYVWPRNYLGYDDELQTVIKFSCKNMVYGSNSKDGNLFGEKNDRIRLCAIRTGPSKPDWHGVLTEDGTKVKTYTFLGAHIKKDGKIKVYSIGDALIKLKDDSFLVYDSDEYLVIRFDKNLNTKFKPKRDIPLGDGRILKGNFFILPYEKTKYFYEHVVKNYTGELTQDIAKQWLEYLYKLQQDQA